MKTRNRSIHSISLSFSTVGLLILSLVLLFAFNQEEIPALETGSQKPMPDEWIDSETGHKVIKLTRIPGDNRSFYFHNNPFIPELKDEGDLMVFYHNPKKGPSDKRVDWRQIRQLYSVNLKTLEVKQITHSSSRIFGEIVGKKRREVFYQSGDTIFATHADNLKTRVVYVFPDSLYRPGIRTLNASEELLAGTFSTRVKRKILRRHPQKGSYFYRIFEAKIPHTLFIIHMETGELNFIHSDTAWLNHVQFSPAQPNKLMFCHEGPWHLLDRIWYIDIEEKVPKLMHIRTMDMEIAGHEFFSRDGRTIWYDLQQPKGQTFYLAGVEINSGHRYQYAMKRNEWSIHFNISPDQKTFAGDGGDSTQVARAKDGKWIYLFTPQGDSLHSEKLVSMKHHDYDLEPNVHFSPDGKWIIFRANFEGRTNVYAVEIKKTE